MLINVLAAADGWPWAGVTVPACHFSHPLTGSAKSAKACPPARTELFFFPFFFCLGWDPTDRGPQGPADTRSVDRGEWRVEGVCGFDSSKNPDTGRLIAPSSVDDMMQFHPLDRWILFLPLLLPQSLSLSLDRRRTRTR